MRILIEPNDVLMFRESKPYTAGEAHLARSIFPLPQAIAGALRSAILINNNFSDEACEFTGYKEDEPKFEILGHFLFKDKEFFSTPLDVVKAKGVEGYFFVKPLFLEHWNRFIFKGKSIHFESVGGFLSFENLIEYLREDLNEDELEDIVRHDLIIKESRIGIKLGDTKTTEEGFLYKAEFLRLSKCVKISVWIGEDGGKLNRLLGNNGLIRLGGECRFARFEVKDENPLSKLEKVWDEIKEEINRNGEFKLYVATPLLVKNDNRYTWDVMHLLENELNVRIRNIYPLVGKPLVFSGWNYANNRPKPNRYAIPSGSVYFVEFEGKIELDRPYLKLGKLKGLGYGLCFMGVGKW